MAHGEHLNNSLPPEMTAAIQKIGEHVKVARIRRKLTMAEMASRMFVSRKTLARLEKGEPGVSLAVLVSALWVLGLNESLQRIADPLEDTVGIFHERKNLPKRVRASKQVDELDF